MRLEEKCELVGDSAHLNSTGVINFTSEPGWNHIESNYDRKTVSFLLFIFLLGALGKGPSLLWLVSIGTGCLHFQRRPNPGPNMIFCRVF